MELWASQGYVGETGELTLAANSYALGGLKAMERMIDMIDEMKEDEQ